VVRSMQASVLLWHEVHHVYVFYCKISLLGKCHYLVRIAISEWEMLNIETKIK
jgi:hypothetical protein